MENEGGGSLHDRYLITEVGGVGFGAGLSAEGDHQTVNVQLLDTPIYDAVMKDLDPQSRRYNLLESFKIFSDGSIEEC